MIALMYLCPAVIKILLTPAVVDRGRTCCSGRSPSRWATAGTSFSDDRRRSDATGGRCAPSTGGFVVALDGFTGPLDLLLHLVREEQIDIADIPVARIADQFLAAIHALGLNQAADYLEMAGRLIRLKVQLLLPRHGDDEMGWIRAPNWCGACSSTSRSRRSRANWRGWPNGARCGTPAATCRRRPTCRRCRW